MVRFRFDCVFYLVQDLDSAVAFYEDVFGFRLTSRDAVARFDVDGTLFELVPVEKAATVGGGGNARLTLAVDDIEAARLELERKDVRVGEVRTVANGRLFTVWDPDGNELVVWQYGTPSGEGARLGKELGRA